LYRLCSMISHRLARLVISLRPWSFPMTATSVSLGAALAYKAGHGDALRYLLVLAGAVLAHGSANLFNDYFDTKLGVDRPTSPTAIYRPHPIFAGFLSMRGLVVYALALIAAAAAIGLYLALSVSLAILPIMCLGALLMTAYSGLLKLKHVGAGEAVVFAVWGPLMVEGAYCAMSGELSAAAALASLPLGLMVSCVLLANNIRDIGHDAAAGLRTVAVRLGRERSLALYASMLASAYVLTAALVALGVLPLWSLLSIATLPMAARLVRDFMREVPPDADPRTANLAIAYGAMLAASILI